jgi:hypothetical protein
MADFFTGFADEGGIRGLASSLHLRFTDELDRQYWVDNPEGLPELPLFKHGDKANVREMSYGTFGGLDLQLFTLDLLTYPDDPGFEQRTCAMFRVPAHFTTLTVSPHSRLSRIREKSNDPFAYRFRVLSRDPEAAELVLDEGMQRWLLDIGEHVRIELSGSTLLGHTRAAATDDIPLLLQQVYGVYLRIPDKAWEHFGFGYLT